MKRSQDAIGRRAGSAKQHPNHRHRRLLRPRRQRPRCRRATQQVRNSRRLMSASGSEDNILSAQMSALIGAETGSLPQH